MDKMAKLGAKGEQKNNPVSLKEMKTITKSLHSTPQPKDSYHLQTRSQQVVIFRLRSDHNRLNKHLYKKMRAVPSPMCPCGDAEQDTAHVLDEWRNHQQLRKEVWPVPETLHSKLYGPLDSLQRTTHFISRSGLQVGRRSIRIR